MAPVTLPPSFYNSFWSADYRSGLQVLFNQLDQGCKENDELAGFIEAQVKGHHAVAASLMMASPSSSDPSGSSSSLQFTLLTLKGAASARGDAHRALAIELDEAVLVQFKQWKDRHQQRIKGDKDDVLGKSGVIGRWEKDAQKLAALRQTYLAKSRAADDREDDAKFAPTAAPASPGPPIPSSPAADHYTKSPPPKSPALLRRTGTVADRISEKLRAASVSRPSPLSGHQPTLSIEGKTLPRPPTPDGESNGLMSPSSPKEEKFTPPTHDVFGKISGSAGGNTGKELPDSPTSPARSESAAHPLLLAGLSLSAGGLKDILRRFDAYLLTTPAPYSDASVQPTTRSNAALASRARSTVLGKYEKTFSGEEVADWLKQHVEGFGGDFDRCVEAASELNKMGHISRIGVGRGFEPNYDTYYTLKLHPSEPQSAAAAITAMASPYAPAASANIQHLLKNAQSYLPNSLAQSDEPLHIRLRRDAAKADEAYKAGVRIAEEARLDMEEQIERSLRLWETWERERLSVVKRVLKQYDDASARLIPRLTQLQPASALAVEAYNPQADMKALIEGNRTGSFRPQPHVYESIESDIPDVNFGIELRKWSGDHGWKSTAKIDHPKGSVPDVLTGLLQAVTELGESVPDEAKRMAWIYEVPLATTHTLRNMLNDPNLSLETIVEATKGFDLPIAVSVVKLYFLELNPPVLGWEGWEDAKAVYPAVGADQERDVTSALTSVLGRLPGIQLFVLNTIVKHLKSLIDTTKTEEANEVYITKISLSFGRCLLRPQYESGVTIHDRTPALFLADLLTQYDAVFPPLVDKKLKESERVMPVRKRTVLVDQRISRSSLPADKDPQEVLEMRRSSFASQKPEPVRPESPRPAPARSPAPSSEQIPSLADRKSVPEKVQAPPQSAPVAQNGPPEMRPPADSDDEDGPITVVPPTPQPKQAGRMETNHGNEPEEMGSPTADILESMQSTLAADDEAPLSLGAASVKRATSGEAVAASSRLRGPRGARGPRPAPGRVPSHSAQPSIGALSALEGGHDSQDEGGRQSPALTGSGRTSPASPAVGLQRGPRAGHSTRGSVSAAIAQFENRN